MNEYLDFAIKQINEAINNNKTEIYIGYNENENEVIGISLSYKHWEEYTNILKEYAIDEECYEYCDIINDLKEKIINFNKF
ncbi:MAG: hypothetical protein ACOCP8_08620 [archaeon]